LLDVSRITTGKIELRRARIDVATVIERAVSMTRPLFDEAGQSIDILIADPTLRIDVDVTRMVQMVSNLLINASKYSEPRSTTVLAAEREGDHVVIAVVDQGRGIEPELLPTIFDSFVQAARDRGGLGVGLTLARRLVEMHGGTITAHSDGAGDGSRFEVRVPLAPAPAAGLDAPVAAPPEPEEEAAPLRVVLIDDNPDIRETMQTLLECLGHQVAVACDGPSGVALVLSQQPQVALVDIGLPGFDGYTVARKLRASMPPDVLRLVAMTGFGQTNDRDQALAAGFDSHLIKPARTDQIQRALRGG